MKSFPSQRVLSARAVFIVLLITILPTACLALAAINPKTGQSRYSSSITEKIETRPHADRNEILGFKVVSSSPKELVMEVTYNYTGSNGEKAYIGVVPANNRETAQQFGFRPTALTKGIHTYKVQIVPAPFVSEHLTTHQITIFMYEGGMKPFLERFYDFDMNWF